MTARHFLPAWVHGEAGVAVIAADENQCVLVNSNKKENQDSVSPNFVPCCPCWALG